MICPVAYGRSSSSSAGAVPEEGGLVITGSRTTVDEVEAVGEVLRGFFATLVIDVRERFLSAACRLVLEEVLGVQCRLGEGRAVQVLRGVPKRRFTARMKPTTFLQASFAPDPTTSIFLHPAVPATSPCKDVTPTWRSLTCRRSWRHDRETARNGKQHGPTNGKHSEGGVPRGWSALTGCSSLGYSAWK